jgi:methyl-accepting chemotaxis protein
MSLLHRGVAKQVAQKTAQQAASVEPQRQEVGKLVSDMRDLASQLREAAEDFTASPEQRNP